MGKKHKTPQEIMAECNRIAREKRMCDRTPWTAIAVLGAYTLYHEKNFKAKRINRILQKVNECEAMIESGKLDIKSESERLVSIADFSFYEGTYTEEDIKYKKGTYDYWLDQKSLEPQNRINELSTRYSILFFLAMHDEYGYGRKRLTALYEFMQDNLKKYVFERGLLHQWRVELLDNAGIAIEDPKDPLNQTVGSVLTGL